ncbi:DUF6153 family protein [Microbacterium sp. CJ88]|uniref:DUF6153 family protein n=1 Tax=Microbacterium sp. CJ88 TaxID=3445672 RepID=UPI003F65D731
MSLIASTAQLRAGRPLARTLLFLIALTGAVIVGLLAMHSLNTSTAVQTSHHAVVTTVEASATGDHPLADSALTMAESSVHGGTGHDDMIAMACVLALLAAVLLFVLPRGVRHPLSLFSRFTPRMAIPRGGGLRPPSLTALCISRT